MARIRRLGRKEVSGSARDAFERKIAERGSIPNMYRVFAHRPWILATMDAHFAAVMGSGTVSLKLWRRPSSPRRPPAWRDSPVPSPNFRGDR